MKYFRVWELSPSLIFWCMPISLVSISGIRQFIVHIPSTDVTLMGYFVKIQVMAISRSIRYIVRSNTGFITSSIILVPQRGVLFRIHLEIINTVSILGEFRFRFGDLLYSILIHRLYLLPCTVPTRLPGRMCLGLTGK